MVFRTSAEWRERGFLIRTGARSYARNRWGTALFHRDQVRLIHPTMYPTCCSRVVHVHHYH